MIILYSTVRNDSVCGEFLEPRTEETSRVCALVLEGCLMVTINYIQTKALITPYNSQPLVGIFGLLGNGLSISVLSSKEMNNSFHKLLLSLAVFDSVFIIFVIFEYTFVRGEE